MLVLGVRAPRRDTWGSCRVHALAVTGGEGPPDDLTPEEFLEQDDLDDTAPSAVTLLLDLDYIVRRVGQREYFRDVRFWVSPGTLVFRNVSSIACATRSVFLPLETENLRRLERESRDDDTGWHLAGRGFDLTIRSPGFTLFLRQPPRYGRRVLRMAERGGINFEARSFA